MIKYLTPQLRIGGSTGTGTESIQGMMMLYNFYNSQGLASVTYQTVLEETEKSLWRPRWRSNANGVLDKWFFNGIQILFSIFSKYSCTSRFNLYKFD